MRIRCVDLMSATHSCNEKLYINSYGDVCCEQEGEHCRHDVQNARKVFQRPRRNCPSKNAGVGGGTEKNRESTRPDVAGVSKFKLFI